MTEAAEAALHKGDVDVEANIDPARAVDACLARVLPARSVPIDQLKAGHPAVVGLRDDPESAEGHAYVLIGATYRERSKVITSLATVVDEHTQGVSKRLADRLDLPTYDVVAVELVDPWEEDDPTTERNEMLVRLGFEDFGKRLDFVATEADARAALESWKAVVAVDVEADQ